MHGLGQTHQLVANVASFSSWYWKLLIALATATAQVDYLLLSTYVSYVSHISFKQALL